MDTLTPLSNPTSPLPRLVRASRRGPVLHETPLAPAPDILGLNLTRGCGHQCAFCSVRASPNYPGDELVLFTNTVDLIRQELSGLKPRAVYLCPGSDPFPPYPTVQTATAEVVEVLAAHGVGSWLMTRGDVQVSILERLRPLADRMRFTIALPSLDARAAAMMEVNAAPPEVRLELIARLKDMGVAVQVALDPLIPQLNDTPEALNPLLDALAVRGVNSLTVSYLFLRQNIVEQMRIVLPGDIFSAVITAYHDGPVLSSTGLAGARYLPRSRRQRGYATLMALASRHGMTVKVSALTNPDFSAQRPITQPAPSLLAAYRKSLGMVSA